MKPRFMDLDPYDPLTVLFQVHMLYTLKMKVDEWSVKDRREYEQMSEKSSVLLLAKFEVYWYVQ